MKIAEVIKRKEIIIAGITLVAGILLGALLFGGPKEDIDSHDGHVHDEMVVDGESIYTCSMHPQIRQNEPGQCPICAMDLIVVDVVSSDDDQDPNEIQMSESAIKLADIKTVRVSMGVPEKSLHLLGKVKPDERNIAKLTARFGGRMEKLYVNYTGQHVKKGEKLGMIYSPDLITAQKELLEAARSKETNPSFYSATRMRLKLWDLSETQINEIEENGEPTTYFEVLSPISGTVSKRNTSEGDYVKEGTILFEVIDLSTVWVLFEAYESDLPWIDLGDKVSFTLQSKPGKTFEGRISFIDPFIDPATRITTLRVEVSNPGSDLKPEMFANGRIESGHHAPANSLLIPRTSILWTGKRAVVYVKIQEREMPTFLYREVILGPEAGNFYIVREGLEEGEEIAMNGVFKIDASAQLAGKQSMMNPDGGKVSQPHDHSAMTMETQSANTGDAHPDHSGDKEMVIDEIDIPDEFKSQLQEVYNAYSLMNDAFISSDPKAVRKKAKKVQAGLAGVDMGLLKGDGHMAWMKQLEVLSSEIEKIAGTNKLDQQRISYATFNDTFYKSLKIFGIDSGTVYYQYCPMANGDTGAFWFSTIKDIRNPYFGDEMLMCGETKDTLEFN